MQAVDSNPPVVLSLQDFLAICQRCITSKLEYLLRAVPVSSELLLSFHQRLCDAVSPVLYLDSSDITRSLLGLPLRLGGLGLRSLPLIQAPSLVGCFCNGLKGSVPAFQSLYQQILQDCRATPDGWDSSSAVAVFSRLLQSDAVAQALKVSEDCHLLNPASGKPLSPPAVANLQRNIQSRIYRNEAQFVVETLKESKDWRRLALYNSNASKGSAAIFNVMPFGPFELSDAVMLYTVRTRLLQCTLSRLHSLNEPRQRCPIGKCTGYLESGHERSCSAATAAVQTLRHDGVVRCLCNVFTFSGLPVREEVWLRRAQRAAAAVDPLNRRRDHFDSASADDREDLEIQVYGTTIFVDVTIVETTAPSYCSSEAAVAPTEQLKRREREKIADFNRKQLPVQGPDFKAEFVPFVVSSTGEIGPAGAKLIKRLKTVVNADPPHLSERERQRDHNRLRVSDVSARLGAILARWNTQAMLKFNERLNSSQASAARRQLSYSVRARSAAANVSSHSHSSSFSSRLRGRESARRAAFDNAASSPAGGED
jgi:hypothetical protein